MNKQSLTILLVIIFFLFVSRLLPSNFPALTSDEARIVYRGYMIANHATDELGRAWPLIFNSLTDYQFPAVSYITAIGERSFGKTDLGFRMPFVIVWIVLIILTYKIAQLLNQRKDFWIFSALVLAFSPALIFLSRVPNDSIVLACLITLLFFLIARNKSNTILTVSVIILLFTVSKFAWFIVFPFVTFTLFFYQNNLSKKAKIILSIFSLILTVVIMGFYLQVPQSRRSLSENNFSIFLSTTIKNGINKTRGQGIQSGWPNYVETILFNKTDFIFIGIMHWLSNLQPSIYFGQLDKSGQLNFSQAGALNKVLIIPFVWGLIYLVRKGRKKEKLLLVYFIILTFPAIFVYPNLSQDLVVLTLPFAVFVIAFGFMQFRRAISFLIISVMILELILSLLYLVPEKKNTNLLRPGWVKGLTEDAYHQSIYYKTAISDDIINDPVSFVELYNPVDIHANILDVPYPYKFRQTSLGNIKIIGSDNEFYSCKENNYDKVFVSKRDKDKVQGFGINTIKTYKDGLDQEVAYLLEKSICIK